MSLDIFNLPDKSLNTQVFYKSTYWNIPKGVNMIFIFAAGGGNGGNGGSNSPTGNGTGGSGGNNGYSGRIMIPTSMISNVLQINVGTGGNGGVAGGTGNAGSASSVLSYVGQGTSTINVFTLINSSDSTGSSTLYTSIGISAGNSTSSVGGLSGGVGAAGQSSNYDPTIVSTPFTGGAGGGGHSSAGANFSGGSILSVGYRPEISGGVVGNINGTDGYTNITPFFASGGGGGASNATGTGGKGGIGGVGCGGGGGGSGITGGAGGKGGDGIVIITCW